MFDNDDLSRVPTVQTNGSISLPLLGEVQVAGLTVAEVQRKITNLLAKDYLRNPQVEVKVKEFQSQFVSVVGEVNSPGRKPIRGRMRLVDALLESGGFKASASGEVLITRTDGTFDDGKPSITVRISSSATLQDQINLAAACSRTATSSSALPKSFVTVDGEVNRPGRYAIESDLTVTGAVSLAGGFTRFGSSDVKVRRTDPQTGQGHDHRGRHQGRPQRQEAGRAAASERRGLGLAPGVLMASVRRPVGGPAARRRPRHRPPLLPRAGAAPPRVPRGLRRGGAARSGSWWRSCRPPSTRPA